MRVPSGSASTRSTICDTVWLSIGKARRRRIGHADARPQQAHVVVDLGDGADGRARVLRGGLLLDGDGRRQAVDLVDVRLLHHLEELPRIGGQRLHITPLALGIDGVEGERGLARAGQAGEHDQFVARNGDVDVLQIVLAGAADGDLRASRAGGLGRSGMVQNVVRTGRFCQCAAEISRAQKAKGRRDGRPSILSVRAASEEAVIHADAHDVRLERDIGGGAAAGRRATGEAAEVGVEIFELGRPGSGEGPFDAGAGCPADLGFGFHGERQRRQP